MANIIGTTGDETLVGTPGPDTLYSEGGTDLLLGKGGGDTYDLEFNYFFGATAPDYRINEKWGGDNAIDTITGLGALVQNNYAQGFSYTTFQRTGADGQNLIINTAYKGGVGASAFMAGTVKIVAQHSTTHTHAQVEKLFAGGVEYNLLTTDTGTAGNDILTGWKFGDVLTAGDGDDYLSGGGGRDQLRGEDGNDTMFGDGGGDFMYGGAGIDRMFGGAGNDRGFGGLDNDIMHGGTGRDILRGEDGDDTLHGDDQNDRLVGGSGNDRLTGGADDDILTGNKGGDTYVFSSLGDGLDTIIDRGNAAYQKYGWLTWNMDEVEFTGYADLDEAVHNLDIQYSGQDLILTYTNPAAPGMSGQITVQDHFLSDKFALEQVDFGTGGFEAIYHIAFVKGDDYTYSVHGGKDTGGNDIVLGSSADEEIYAGLGSDIVFGGGGSDHFMFHDEEENRGGTDLILDFDLADDTLDFTDIAGLGFSAFTVSTSDHGNALITSVYGGIELQGIAAIDVNSDIFMFG